MSKLVSDGEERYLEAHREELQRIYEQRVADIKKRYTTTARLNILKRGVRYVAIRREVTRAKREFSKDNLYLLDPGSGFC